MEPQHSWGSPPALQIESKDAAGADAVHFGILGPLEISNGDISVEVNGPKQRALLILLLLHSNKVVSTDRIVDALWDSEVNGKEIGTLRVHIANLRKALEPDRGNGTGREILLTRSPGYLLRIDPDEIDAQRFARLAAEGRRALADDAGLAADRLTEALGLWRGSALEDVTYETFAQAEIQRLDELRLSAIEDLIEARLAQGEHAEVVGELESLVAVHPFRERLWGHLMLALYRSGRQADALGAHRRLSDILGGQGLAPGPELRLLEDRILLDDPTLMMSARKLGPHRQPPAERTRLIGRADEMAELLSRLALTRLLTLTGTGGVGKTRLAQRLAWSMIEEGAEVWWVELSALTDALLLPERVAAAGGISQGGNVDTVDVLMGLLSARETVIVLDNCEHVVDAAARLVDRLLAGAPGVRFIVTSREHLQVDGEMVWRVPSLPVPDADTPAELLEASPSVEMFMERSRARDALIGRWAIPAVATICARLDGIPLAIELAAARTTTLSPGEISERLTDRFSLLEKGGRTALSRHRTLEAAIDWSFQLLGERDRRLLSRLAVFVAGFDRAAAQQVCAFGALAGDDVEAGLERLVEKSMIERSTHGPEQRFHLTESIQAFAWDRLMDDPREVMTRHRDWAVGLAVTGGRSILADESRWFLTLEAAHEDLRAAFNESMHRGDVELALRLAGSLGAYFLWRRSNEALKWLERAVEAAERAPETTSLSTRALGLLAIGPFLCYNDRLDEGRQRLAEAAELYTALDHRAGLMWTRYQQSHFPAKGDPEESVRHAESAADLARQLSDPVSMGYGLTRLAETRLSRLILLDRTTPSELEEVIALCEEAAVYCQRLPQATARDMLKGVRGTTLVLQGRPEGLALIEEGAHQRNRFAHGISCSAEFISASQIAHSLGDEDRSAALLRHGLQAYKDLGLPCTARAALVGAAAALLDKNPPVAAQLLHAAGPLRPSFLYGTRVFVDEEQLFDRVSSELTKRELRVDEEPVTHLEVNEAIDLALAHIG